MTTERSSDVERLTEIWASLPTIECKRLCQSFCGPIMMSQLEADQIKRKYKSLPQMTKTGACSSLSLLGSCSVYELRPSICRLFGMISVMRCPHGCKPSRMLSDAEAREVLTNVLELSGPYVAASNRGKL